MLRSFSSHFSRNDRHPDLGQEQDAREVRNVADGSSPFGAN